MKADNLLLWASLWATAVKGYNLTFYDSPNSDCTGKVLASNYEVRANVCDTKFRDSGVDIWVDSEEDESHESVVEFYSDASCEEPIGRYTSQPSCTGKLLFGSFQLVQATDDEEPSEESSEMEKRGIKDAEKISPYHGERFDHGKDENGLEQSWYWQELWLGLFVARSERDWHSMKNKPGGLPKANKKLPPTQRQLDNLAKRSLGLNSLLARNPPTLPGPGANEQDCRVVPAQNEGPQALYPPDPENHTSSFKELATQAWDLITRASLAARIGTYEFLKKYPKITVAVNTVVVGIIVNYASIGASRAGDQPASEPPRCPNFENLPLHYQDQINMFLVASERFEDKGKSLDAHFEGGYIKKMSTTVQNKMTCPGALAFINEECAPSETVWTTKEVTGE